MTELYENLIAQKTEKYLALCINNPEKWIHFSKDDCGRHRRMIYNRVQDMLKLMAIRYAIELPFPAGSEDYGYPLKIKVKSTG